MKKLKLTFTFTRGFHTLSHYFIIRDSGKQHPTSGDSVVAVSGTHARACYTTEVFKVGNFNVYLDLLLLIFRNWLLLSFNFLFFNLLSSCCN